MSQLVFEILPYLNYYEKIVQLSLQLIKMDIGNLG